MCISGGQFRVLSTKSAQCTCLTQVNQQSPIWPTKTGSVLVNLDASPSTSQMADHGFWIFPCQERDEAFETRRIGNNGQLSCTTEFCFAMYYTTPRQARPVLPTCGSSGSPILTYWVTSPWVHTIKLSSKLITMLRTIAVQEYVPSAVQTFCKSVARAMHNLDKSRAENDAREHTD